MSFKPGCIGTLTGTLHSVQYKTSAKGKRWVSFSLKRGKQTISMKSFVAAVVTGLELYVEGEEISLFGKLGTTTKDGKNYTAFSALKLYDTPQEDSGMTVAGEVTAITPHEHGADVWVDCTENPDFPEEVKFQVGKGVVLPFVVGEVIAGAKLEPRGKFCFWTLDTGISPEREKPTEYNGKPIKDMSEMSYAKADGTAAPAKTDSFPAEAEDSLDY